MEKKFTPCYS